MVTYSITLTPPPPKIPLVGLEQAAKNGLATVKSPKSCAFPVDAIVI